VFLAFFNPFAPIFDPLTKLMGHALDGLHMLIPNYGWAVIVLAFVLRVVLTPFSILQTRSMAAMQKVQPLITALKAKYKDDPQRMQQEQMLLFKENNVNPLAGCLPGLLPIAILIPLFYALKDDSRLAIMKEQHWLWIGSPLSHLVPPIGGLQIFASDLKTTDLFLLALYVVSMYFTVRYGSPPSTDPQAAQTQRLMAFISPAMIAWFGIQAKWPSALYIYWLASNIFTVAQMLIIYRRFGLMGPKADLARAQAAAAAPINVTPKGAKANGDGAKPALTNGKSGSAKKRTRR
jgi:YidC/Oxa1 family membrane protein insertase